MAFNLTHWLSLRVIQEDLRNTVDNIISYLSCYLAFSDSLNIGRRHSQREDTEYNAKEAGQNVSVGIRFLKLGIVYLICNKVAANIEGIGIIAEHHKEEASNSKCCL
jgi:hypothetical protein